ncbi:response regulator [Aurantiacibacter suaedae]|uniref:response regulator n=1 Tax=Aurantiacibacter suaedae TaxID=2545755 RepID=UPI0013868A2C|nr:response regulator [Aurantiacibacter suaedae]
MAQILLVDASGLAAEHATQVMIAAGHSCGWVPSAEEAMRILNRHRPDLLLLEDRLPGQSGIGLLTDLRDSRAFRDLPVIMLTTTYEFRAEQMARRIGAQDYIHKPFTPSMLQFRVRRVLEMHRTHPRYRSGAGRPEFGAIPAHKLDAYPKPTRVG